MTRISIIRGAVKMPPARWVALFLADCLEGLALFLTGLAGEARHQHQCESADCACAYAAYEQGLEAPREPMR